METETWANNLLLQNGFQTRDDTIQAARHFRSRSPTSAFSLWLSVRACLAARKSSDTSSPTAARAPAAVSTAATALSSRSRARWMRDGAGMDELLTGSRIGNRARVRQPLSSQKIHD
jgi:hypothetical protein